MLLPLSHVAALRDLKPRLPGCKVPMTNEQLRAWTLVHQRENGRSKRLLHFESRVRGDLDADRLRLAVEAAMQRHEALRTRFVLGADGPIPIIADTPNIGWQVVDVSALPRNECDEKVKALCLEFLEERVDLSQGPLLAARLLRVAPDEHIFIVAVDHMITDLMSNAILQREIWSFYRERTDRGPMLPKLFLQHADYVVWEQEGYDSWRRSHGDYWRCKLSGAPATALPFEHALCEQPNSTYRSEQLELGSQVTKAFRAIAAGDRTTLPIVVMTFYVAVMSRWCQQRDFLVAFVSHARFCPSLATMVGSLATSLYLRIEVGLAMSFLELLRHVGAELSSAYEHWDCNRVRRLLPNLPADSALTFDWLPAPRAGLPSKGAQETTDAIRLEPYQLEMPLPVPFMVLFAEGGTGVVATVTHQVGLIRTSAIENLKDDLISFAAAVAADPQRSIAPQDDRRAS
jgi:hypothetical protein